jgi:hypothetical protein
MVAEADFEMEMKFKFPILGADLFDQGLDLDPMI